MCTGIFMKSVHSWMEESAYSVSTFQPNDSKISFTGGITQGTVTGIKYEPIANVFMSYTECTSVQSLHQKEAAFVIGEQN